MEVEVKHGVQNPVQEANIANLLKKFSGFYEAQKLNYHAGLPLVPIYSITPNPFSVCTQTLKLTSHCVRTSPQLLSKRVGTVTSAITHVSLTRTGYNANNE